MTDDRTPTLDRFPAAAVRAFAASVAAKAGMAADAATAVAEGLVEADLYGHVTHGLALLPDYVEEIDNGTMARTGHPRARRETITPPIPSTPISKKRKDSASKPIAPPGSP